MSRITRDQSRRLSSEERSPSDGGGSWASTIWGIAVVVVGFVAIQASRHFTDTDAPQTPKPRVANAEERQALLDKGVSVDLVIHSCSEEYAGPPHGDLHLVKQAADIESTVAIANRTKQTQSTSANQLPNANAGEFARCRLVYSDDGKVFLNTHERASVGGTDVLDIAASYELEIVDGSRADYDTGRPVRLAYTSESLEKRREALRKSLALQWLPLLQREVSSDSTMTFNMKCIVEPLPQSTIRATPSSLFIEDGGPVKATITVTVSER